MKTIECDFDANGVLWWCMNELKIRIGVPEYFHTVPSSIGKYTITFSTKKPLTGWYVGVGFYVNMSDYEVCVVNSKSNSNDWESVQCGLRDIVIELRKNDRTIITSTFIVYITEISFHAIKNFKEDTELHSIVDI